MIRKLIALALIMTLAGCASLPTKIDVRQGPELIPDNSPELTYYTPSGPIAGSGPEEIVSGFLAAGTGPQNGYGVAREYLSEDFAQRWQPDVGVLVRTGAPEFRSSGDSLQIVQIKVGARIDEQGRYLDSDEPKTSSLRFQLSKEAGEWRISSAPNLTVVTPPVFAVVFNAFPVYFLDNTSKRLVPDLRWFPTRASTGTRLVNALLDGPAEGLAAGVISAIPEGTKLTIDAVRVLEGVAQVDFDATALEASASNRRLMAAQLRATLLQLAGVSDIAISVNSSPQDISAPPIIIQSATGAPYALGLLGVSRITGGQGATLSTTQNAVTQLEPELFAIDSDANRLAYATASGVYLAVSSSISFQNTLVSDATNIKHLAFDVDGFLWLFPSLASDPIAVIDPLGNQRSIAQPVGTERVSASLSPEGSRLALIAQGVNGPEVQIFSILRAQSGYPIELLRADSLTPVLGQAFSLNWQDGSTLRVLERTTSGLTALSDYPLRGPRTQLSMPPVVGVKIVPGPSSTSTYLLSEAGEVWVLSGGTWRQSETAAIDISTLR
jgi:hypothetical protein